MLTNTLFERAWRYCTVQWLWAALVTCMQSELQLLRPLGVQPEQCACCFLNMCCIVCSSFCSGVFRHLSMRRHLFFTGNMVFLYIALYLHHRLQLLQDAATLCVKQLQQDQAGNTACLAEQQTWTIAATLRPGRHGSYCQHHRGNVAAPGNPVFASPDDVWCA